jgi:DNA-binding CsgD family transcriptional regulator
LADVEYYSGHWDDALAEIDLEERFDPNTLVAMAGIAALVAVHRDEPATVEATLRVADQHTGQAHVGLAGYAVLARALAAERDGRVQQALAVLTDYLHSEPAVGLDYCGWDAVRLAVAAAERPTARRLTEQAESYATATGAAGRRGMALYCRGLVDADAAPLVEAAEIYRHIGRPLLTAMASEAAGGLLAEHGDVPAAGRAFGDAIDSYAALAAIADVSRVRRRLQEFGIRRSPRVVRRPVRGVASLTPTERRVARLVADGLPNPEIANLLFLSRRTVEVHVSHILRKLGRTSRVQVVAALAGSPVPVERH